MSELININKGDEVVSTTLDFNFKHLDEKITSTNQRIETVNASIKSVQSTLNANLVNFEEQVTQDIDTLNTEVNAKLDTKFDKNNQASIVDLMMPDYSRAVSFSGSKYVAPHNGYITGSVGANDATRTWAIDGVQVAYNIDSGVSGTCISSAFVVIGKGQTWTSNASQAIRFIPCKGDV